MGKLERAIQKPERIVVYRDSHPVEFPNLYVRKEFMPYTDVPPPTFTIEKVVEEKRKKVVIGNASDHVIDY